MRVGNRVSNPLFAKTCWNMKPLASTVLGLVGALSTLATAADNVDFDRDVRPILSENCFHCHGPDGQARKADLRLDTRDGIFDSVVVAGKIGDSELYSRITDRDAEQRMPPAATGLKLTESEKDTLRRWIEQGAKWTRHWSFEAPEQPPLPSVEHENWAQNEIDRFVLARLEQAGLEPSATAGRIHVLRRVTLDLTGLPPKPEEVDAFVNDNLPGAYERVVDRLLMSSAYGERMAWPWLAASRYADTDGFQGDPTRTMWPWRDWLINALNTNMPFDQFTVEMLAGDLIPNATPEQIIATGFNRNHMFNGEGGRIPEETRVENVFDRTETTSTVWLGLTMTCSRCHDHKYDPMTQQEYYQLFSFFNNTSETGQRSGGKAPPSVNYLLPEQRRTLKAVAEQISTLGKRMEGPLPAVDQDQKVWGAEQAKMLVEARRANGKLSLSHWMVLGPLSAPGGNAARAFKENLGPEDGVDLKRKYENGKTVWRREPKLVDGKVHQLPNTIGATYLYRTIDSPAKRVLQVSLGSDDGIKVWLNAKQLLSKNVSRGAAPDQEKLRLELNKGRNELLLKIINTGGIAGVYYRNTAESLNGLPAEVAKALLVEDEKRSAADRKLIRQHYRSKFSKDWQTLNAERANLQKQQQAINKSAATVMVMDELPSGKRRKAAVLFRGIYNKPTETTVSAGTPSFLPRLPTKKSPNRLDLAHWLMHPSNPMTARVTVNRYWQLFFGTGLVETSEDFGRQGSRPSHPQLLDWLSTRFLASGWDVKAMHKLIVMSATYRQSSRVSQELLQRDPANQLLARAPRYRMPSWMLRDQALAVGGLLVNRIGGPSVKPYQPPGVWAEATFGKIRYQPDKGEAIYRRSLYIFWRRIVGPTMLFDGGKRQTCEVKPTLTNTPLHALTTLNETTYVESARALAQRVMQAAQSPQDRVTLAFRLAAARRPSSNELSLLTRRLGILQRAYADNVAEANKVLRVGSSPRDESLDAAEHAAYATLCMLLLNLDEVISRE